MPPMYHKQAHATDENIRQHMLQGIAAHRIAGLQFPSYFLGIAWQEITDRAAHLTLMEGPHCRRADGTIDLRAVGVLADHALATAARIGAMPGTRLAGIHMQLQFTGVPVTGDLSAKADLVGLNEGATLQRPLTEAKLYAHDKVLCHASSEFVLLDPLPGAAAATMPWDCPEPPPIASIEAHERVIVEAFDAALAKMSPQAAFIEHFWGAKPRRSAKGASNRIPIGPHICNPSGHVHGGILAGLAAINANAAAPATMMLSNISVWCIGPGRGDALNIRSRIVHAGRAMAVVRTEIKTSGGERVLEAVSHHIARKK